MTALDLLDLCQKAYLEPTLTAGPDGRDAALVTHLPSGEMIFAFRGTTCHLDAASLLDWINDFRVCLTTLVGAPGRVHEGFAKDFANLEPLVREKLKEGPLEHSRRQVWFTGHSLGGALAILAGSVFSFLCPKVMTFAAPRVGNRKFAALYPLYAQVTRYEGKDDIVPLLPPLGYHSPGKAIEESEANEFLRRLHVGELVAEEQWDKIVSGHHLQTYRSWIERLPLVNLSLVSAA